MAGAKGKLKAVAIQGGKATRKSSTSRTKKKGGGVATGGVNRKKARRSASINALPSTIPRVLLGPGSHLQVIYPPMIRYLFQKRLRISDVSTAGRIIIPKREAEVHFPKLHDKEGLLMYMEDMDASRVWSLKFRYWPNNRSRMYILDYTGAFVWAHDLRDGDFIKLYKDDMNERYFIRAKKAPINEKVPPRETIVRFPLDNEANKSPVTEFPDMEEVGSPFFNDGAAIFYDFPVHFAGAYQPDLELPGFDQLSSLGSFSLSVDDLFP